MEGCVARGVHGRQVKGGAAIIIIITREPTWVRGSLDFGSIGGLGVGVGLALVVVVVGLLRLVGDELV